MSSDLLSLLEEYQLERRKSGALSVRISAPVRLPPQHRDMAELSKKIGYPRKLQKLKRKLKAGVL